MSKPPFIDIRFKPEYDKEYCQSAATTRVASTPVKVPP